MLLALWGYCGTRGCLIETRWAMPALPADQRPEGRADIRRSHQRFADQHCFDARGPQPVEVASRANAALADEAAVGRDLRGQVQRVFEPREQTSASRGY